MHERLPPRLPILDPVTHQPLKPASLRTCTIWLVDQDRPQTIPNVARVTLDRQGRLTCLGADGQAVAAINADQWTRWAFAAPEGERPRA